MTESQPAKPSPLRPVLFIAIVFAAVAAVTVVSRFWAPPEKIAWRDDLTAAQRDASAANKPVLLYFTASWCGPCQRMRREVWTEQRVAEAMNAYVPVRIDIDRQPALARQYNVQSIPTMAELDSEGAVVRLIDHGVSADEMTEWLRRR